MKLLRFFLVVLAFVQATAGSAVVTSTQATQTSDPKPAPIAAEANEAAAQGRLRQLLAAEATCLADTTEYAELDVLVRKQYVNDPSEGRLANYRFDIRVTANGFEITAVPLKYGVSGLRSFYADQTNLIRAADRKGLPATSSDPVL